MTIRYLNRAPVAPAQIAKGVNTTVTNTTREQIFFLTLPASSPQQVLINYIADSQLQSGASNVVLIQSLLMMTPENAAAGNTAINTAAGSIEREIQGSLLWANMGPRATIGKYWMVPKPEQAVSFVIVASHNGTGSSIIQRTHTLMSATPATSSTAYRELGI